jgi:polyphosphate glucokinase
MTDEAERRVLMIDVGGTHVKLKDGVRSPTQRFDSGPELTPVALVEAVREFAKDAEYDVASVGYPGVVRNGAIAEDPGNLGAGWVGFDFAAALEHPVRIINDAGLQALAAYRGGRMLFIGLGTGTAGALALDGVVAPLELGELRLTRADTLADCVANRSLEELGEAQWREHVQEALALLQRVFRPDEIVVGGGNARLLGELPNGCRKFKNEDAYLGALRLWGHHGVRAFAQGSSWRFEADWKSDNERFEEESLR